MFMYNISSSSYKCAALIVNIREVYCIKFDVVDAFNVFEIFLTFFLVFGKNGDIYGNLGVGKFYFFCTLFWKK